MGIEKVRGWGIMSLFEREKLREWGGKLYFLWRWVIGEGIWVYKKGKKGR